MIGTYKLSATPSLITEGQFEGELKGVWFAAVSPTDSKQWFAVNCGQFERAFGKLVPHRLAAEIVATLMRGDNIEFPDLYQEGQLGGGFHYEWSPVYFVPPPLESTKEDALSLSFQELVEA